MVTALLVSLLAQTTSLAAPGTIRTVAGGGSGDGIAAIDASLWSPTAIATDVSGNVYIADTDRHSVRRVATNGVITTIAGTGSEGFFGDGGPAKLAQLRQPQGVAVDIAGNVFVSDTGNNRIRKIDTSGTMSTVAGLGVGAYTGDGLPASTATLAAPEGLAMALDGSLLIADASNHAIRRIDPSGTMSTIAGTGIEGAGPENISARLSLLNHPESVAVTGDGTVFIADTFNHRVRKITADGALRTVAGTGAPGFSGDGGPAPAATLRYPETIAIAGESLLIGDSHNRRIRMVDSGDLIQTVVGTGQRGGSGDGGPATSATISSSAGLAFLRDGSFVFSDTANHRVRRVLLDETIGTFAGSGMSTFIGDGLAATSSSLKNPRDSIRLANGDILIAEAGRHRIRIVSATTGKISTFAGSGGAGFGGDGGPASAASLHWPSALDLGPDGSIYISDSENDRIRRVDPSGTIRTIAGGGNSSTTSVATEARLDYPSGLAVDASGNVFVADAGRNRILRIDPSGTLTTVAGTSTGGFSGDGGPATAATLKAPFDVDVANDGSLYIADSANNRIRLVDAAGIITTVTGTGPKCFYGDGGPAISACLSFPMSVAATADGFLISDSHNHRIRAVGADGLIRSIAGNGYSGFSGDGRMATSAALYYPQGLSVDLAGDLLIADASNERIRIVEGGW